MCNVQFRCTSNVCISDCFVARSNGQFSNGSLNSYLKLITETIYCYFKLSVVINILQRVVQLILSASQVGAPFVSKGFFRNYWSGFMGKFLKVGNFNYFVNVIRVNRSVIKFIMKQNYLTLECTREWNRFVLEIDREKKLSRFKNHYRRVKLLYYKSERNS